MVEAPKRRQIDVDKKGGKPGMKGSSCMSLPTKFALEISSLTVHACELGWGPRTGRVVRMVEGNRGSRVETDVRRRSRCLCRTGGHDEEGNSQALVRERVG